MELKPYQQSVINDLKSYLEKLEETSDISKAFTEFWREHAPISDELIQKQLATYKNNVPGVPNVCVKVPTAGGKTFIACNALRTLFDFIRTDTKTVLWLVPSITILEQTIKNLSNQNHPYRQRINTQFSARVEIYTKDKLLQGASFNPTSVIGQLNIIVMSFDTLRIKKKEDRKIYQENGQLAGFANLKNASIQDLPDTDESALINVIRKLNPVVIVDESHNAETELSLEMLRDVNPSFIFDLTATPRKNSNIISYVDIGELKTENMVKLPVIVYNHIDKTEVFSSAIQLQRKLEAIAIEEEKTNGKYIRPIVLFQAQPKNNDDSVHFQKLKEKLIEMRIPEEQIKIKTANINEIKGIDLLARDCPVRFIITIDALKEGWDCPFAYILASVADKNSSVAVEQILGRILRQPHVIKHKNDLLNIAFVMTASNKFLDTLENIVVAMNKAGFSSKDYRYAEIQKEIETLKVTQTDLPFVADNGKSDLDDIIPERVISAEPTFIDRITQDAIKQASEYNATVAKEVTPSNRSFFLPDEIKDKVKKIEINMNYKDRIIDIRLPRFYLKEEGGIGLFSDGEELFSKENLLTGFKLSKADTNINFDETSSEAYSVDVEKVQEDYAVKFKKLDRKIQERLEEYILSAAKDVRVRELTARMKELIGSIWPIKDSELEKYLTHIFEDFNLDKIKDCLSKEYYYKDKIKTKIDKLSSEYVKTQFLKNLVTNKIILKPDYQIPIEQFFGDLYEYGITKSIYSKEFRMNEFEKLVINKIANLDNVLAWTKNPEKKGFCINGFINHYPDFIVLFKSGKLALVETKGDFLDNTDSIAKIELGLKWADKAGNNFKYIMVLTKVA